MTTFGYLRVSTDKQDVENQRHGLLDYCNSHQLGQVEFHEDTSSARVDWRKSGVSTLLNVMAPGDTMIVSEISRLARSTLQVLEILEEAAKKEIRVLVVKSQLVMDGSLQATISATILGLAAQIEREFISVRTAEALARRRNDGGVIGRPKGPAIRVKLDAHREEIISYLRKGISKRSIAKLLNCSPSTLYSWLDRNMGSIPTTRTGKAKESQQCT